MRKITLLVAMLALVSFVFAQVQGTFAPIKDKNTQTLQKKATKAEGDVVWEVTFDEVTPTWTIGHDQGTKDWTISDTTPSCGYTNAGYLGGTVEVAPLWLYMGHRYVHDWSDSGANFAWVDGISDYFGTCGNTMQICNMWLQFDNLDFTGVMAPKLSMYQNYKGFNGDHCYIDFSTDGGTTWETVEINADVEGNAYADMLFERFVGDYIADEANVSIRFRWGYTAASISGIGYGWQLDDIRIVENPQNDLRLVDARMNFFQYTDYTVAGDEAYFHISSHYGLIPNEEFASEFANMWFNGMVENKGMNAVAPIFSVQVVNPQDEVIFDETITSTVSYNTGMVDTMDMIEVDFALPAEFTSGLYTVMYSVYAEGVEDYNIEDNVDTTYFFVTDTVFGRDLTNMTSYAGPANWLDGHMDGEMFGTDYLFLYDTEVTNMQVFISDVTTPSTAIIGHVMEYSETESTWVDISTTPLYTIEENVLGSWVNLSFADPVIIDRAGEDAKTVMAAIEFYYNSEDNDIWIGYDPTVPVSFWGAKWFLLAGSNANEWVSITNWSRGGLGIRLITADADLISSKPVKADGNASIFPNPSNGLLNVNNVEGANVQVLNILGQTVASIENAQANNTIDMSSFANGSYIIRIVDGSSVSNYTINLAK